MYVVDRAPARFPIKPVNSISKPETKDRAAKEKNASPAPTVSIISFEKPGVEQELFLSDTIDPLRPRVMATVDALSFSISFLVKS